MRDCWCWTLVMAALLSPACALDSQDAWEEKAPQSSVSRLESSTAGTLSPDLTWTLRGPATIDPNGSPKPPIDRGPVLDALSDSELAMAMRPVVVKDGYEYIAQADEPAMTRARAFNRAGVRMRTLHSQPGTIVMLPPPASGTVAVDAVQGLGQLHRFAATAAAETRRVDTPGPLVPFAPFARRGNVWTRWFETGPHVTLEDLDLTEPREIWPPDDDRSWVPHSLTFWWPRIAQISFTGTPWGTGGNCSATLIGRHTAVTAAHCVVDRDSHQWLPLRSWAVAVTRTVNPVTGVTTSTVGYGPVTGCYTAGVPDGWIQTGAAVYDYAVLDFRGGPGGCNLQPGSTTGWLAGAIGSPNDHLTAPSELYGYDADAPLPQQPPAPNHPYLVPSMIQRSKPAWHVWVDSSTPEFLVHYLDATGGSSGAGVLQQLFLNYYGDPTLYWVGDHAFINPLGARRNDWVVWNYITSATTEW